MNSYSKAFISRMTGDDLEDSYAKRFRGAVIGGIRDGGLDVLTGDNRVPYVQVKSSVLGLKEFLAKSLQFKRFIPVCVGEPGEKEEMVKNLIENGVWVGSDIPERNKLIHAVSQVRYLCAA